MRITPTTKLIIGSIAMVAFTGAVILVPGIAAGLKLILKLKKEISRARLDKELLRAERIGYIKRHPHKSGDTFELTPKGRLAFMTQNAFSDMRSSLSPEPKNWDGLWRIVIFDISEEQRQERQLLRKILKNIGFIYLQQSVWVYPYPCDDQIQTFKRELGLTKNAVYIKAQYLEGDTKIKKYFGLKK